MPELIKKFKVDEVVLAYSDLTAKDVIDKASIVLANGADFRLLGPKSTMLKSKKPVIAVCATRTGAGKSTVIRRVLGILRNKSLITVAIRHPMAYGNLKRQTCQRFETYNDFKKYRITVEELEEYEPYVKRGTVVFGGVDYVKILKEAEKEADIILFESGNNDISLIEPDLYITVVDPLRPRGVFSYPGEVNVRLANVIVINKINNADPKDVKFVEESIKKLNTRATVIKANSSITVDKPELIEGKRVIVVEDSPTVTHGSLGYGAGYVAAKKYGAKGIINPKSYAVGSVRKIFEEYKHLKDVLPSIGYAKKQLKDLERTINVIDSDSVVLGTPCDLSRIIRINKPVVHVSFELQEISKPNLEDIVIDFLKKI